MCPEGGDDRNTVVKMVRLISVSTADHPSREATFK